MATAAPQPTDLFDAQATLLSFASAWADAIGELSRASMSACSAVARSYGQMGETYAALLWRGIDLEGVETLMLASSAEQLLDNELHVLEDGAEHFVHAAEEILADRAGSPLVPLPE